MKVGTSPNEIVMFPNVLVFLRQQAPTGGTKGTTVNHIAFAVTERPPGDGQGTGGGYRIVTREEAGANDVVTDDISFNKEQQSYSAFVMGPDEIKVQLFEVKTNATPDRASPHSLCGSGGRDESVVREGLRREAGHAWNLSRPRISRASTCRSPRRPIRSLARAAAPSTISGSR